MRLSFRGFKRPEPEPDLAVDWKANYERVNAQRLEQAAVIRMVKAKLDLEKETSRDRLAAWDAANVEIARLNDVIADLSHPSKVEAPLSLATGLGFGMARYVDHDTAAQHAADKRYDDGQGDQ